MKNLSEQISYGLLAFNKGYLTQHALGLAVQQWLSTAGDLDLGDFLVHSGALTAQQLNGLRSALQESFVLPSVDVETPVDVEVSVVAETQIIADSVNEITFDATADWQLTSTAKPSTPLDRRDKHKRFKIVKQHASGGLGVVYVAEDLQIHREVALKQIRSDRRQDAFSESKFVLEAEITGQLEHPGIVPVYALGVDAEGAPYYAMRFVRGREMKKFIQEFHTAATASSSMFDSLKFRQLIRRFLDVCNAMEYAHSRGILHRDLKPANIMLGNHGETLVVDWGLAKLISNTTEGGLAGKSPPEFPVRVRSSGSHSDTVYGSFSGTVAYAPPEQLEGKLDLLAPASDVYSLGAILYEMLTNQPPITKRPQSISQVVDWIRNGEVPMARSIVSVVPKPLSVICQKAMSYEIADRYASAGELAADLERWLADERVIAFGNREPVLEIAGRLTRRYRSWTVPVAGALVFSTLVVLIGAWLINRSRMAEIEAKAIAIQNKNEAIDRIGVARNAIDTMLVNSTEALRDFPATLDLQSQLLQAAIQDYEKLSQGSSPDIELELERIRAQVRVADILQMQGKFDDAYSKYLAVIDEIEQKSLGPTNQSEQDRLAWNIEFGKAHARLGLAYDLEGKEGRIADAQNHFHQAIAILTAAARDRSPDHPANIALARIQLNFGNSQFMDSQPTDALALIEDSIKRYGEMDVARDQKIQVASLQAFESASRLLGKIGRESEALRYLDTAMTTVHSMLRDNPEDRELLQFQASLQISRSTIRRRRGDYAQALTDLEGAHLTFQQLRQAWPENLDFMESSAITHSDMGLLWLDQLEPRRAKEFLEIALADFEKLFSFYPKIKRYADGLATAYSGLGQAEMQTNPDANVAVNFLIASYNLFAHLIQESGNETTYAFKMATTKGQLAKAKERTDQNAEASQHREESQSLLNQVIQANPSPSVTLPDVDLALSQIEWDQAMSEWAQGRPDVSLDLFQRSLQKLESLASSYPAQGQYLFQLSRALIRCPIQEMQDLKRAEQLALQALSHQPQNLDMVRLVTECKLRLEKTSEAKDYLDRLPVNSPSHQDLGLLAFYESQMNRQDQAIDRLQQMKDRMQQDQPYIAELHRWFDYLAEKIDPR